jgi:hypothetical protein
MTMRPLTERDLETLDDLISGYDQSLKYADETERYGIAPLDFGGSNGSHHSSTATKLAKHGLVDQRKRGAPWGDNRSTGYRGSKVYRPTEAGRNALGAWRTLQRGEIMANLGSTSKYGHSVPKTGYRPITEDEKATLRLVCHLEMPK